MIKYFLFFIVLLAVRPVVAQTSELDELPLPVLHQKLDASRYDTNRVKLQLALGYLILQKPGSGIQQIDSSRSLAIQAEKLSHQLGFDFGVINGKLLSAESYNKSSDSEKGFAIAKQALDFSRRVNNEDGIARSYLVMGQRYKFSDIAGLRLRIDYSNKAIAIFRKLRNSRWLANTLTAHAELLFHAEQKADAIKLLFETLKIGDGVSSKTIERIYWLIARTSAEINDFPNALKYSFLAIRIAKAARDTTLLLSSIYYTTAVSYYYMKDYDRAITYALMAMKIARYHSDKEYISTISDVLTFAYTRANKLPQALALLDEIKNYAKNDPDRLSIAEYYLNNLTYARELKSAEFYAGYLKTLLAKKSAYSLTDLYNSYDGLAYYYTETGHHKLAYYYTDLMSRIAYRKKSPGALKLTERRYYKLDSITGNYRSALIHSRNAQRIQDSVENVTRAYQISLLNIENETEQKNDHIDMLTKQAQVKDSQLKRNQIIQKATITVIALLLVITGLIYNRYRLKHRKNALLLRQKSEIDQQNISLQNLVLDKSQLIGEKDDLLREKDLLLKEVNHRVKNNLQIVMSLLASQSGYMQNKKAQVAILESQNRVQAIALIHDQLYQTERIAEIAIADYITELIQSLDDSINQKRNQIAINCRIDDIMLDVSQAIPVGIILNESVTNALKHAFPGDNTGEIVVMVKQVDEQIAMRISDNGAGLPKGCNLLKTDSLGMTLIKGLTQQLKGDFEIEEGAGVTIIINFPKQNPALMSTLNG